ncbi:hypothetical protein C479_06067 [Halovivax asiaticus JCM 14624]|uniref:Uncharacterized protein n=1 Tax=Halovivax asiaticus JCM 14624 TaxID=1227490 RepID=M0BNW4_9EURY|nr:hypothetical protein [Halovivax asiaticus]ELZ11988.1 hypothetical protein C479_06067 [Halovivax asiaticus JCM 14624]
MRDPTDREPVDPAPLPPVRSAHVDGQSPSRPQPSVLRKWRRAVGRSVDRWERLCRMASQYLGMYPDEDILSFFY